MASISGSVGENAKNRKPDVQTVQSLLNRVPLDGGGPEVPLKIDGLCWQKTLSAIHRFQKVGCGFKWPDRRVDPGKRTWVELDKYDEPGQSAEPAPLPVAKDEPKCGSRVPAGFSGNTVMMHGWQSKLGKYVPVPLDKHQRSVATSVFGSSLDLNNIFVMWRTPPGAKGLCIVGPAPHQNTLFLSSSVDELLIHELTHAWQSQHHLDPTKYMWNSIQSQKLGDLRGESAYWYVANKHFGAYAAEQIAEQVEAGEATIRAHVRSVPARVPDPLNSLTLNVARTEPMAPPATRAPSKY